MGCGVALGGRSLDCGLRPPLEMTGGVSARDSKECWPSAALVMTESIGLYSGRQVRGLTWDERRYPWIDSLRHPRLDLHCHPRLDRGSCAEVMRIGLRGMPDQVGHDERRVGHDGGEGRA